MVNPIPIRSYTHSSLAAWRRCPTEFDFAYMQQLDSDADDAEHLQVGTVWHKAQEALGLGKNPYTVIHDTAPGKKWEVKLSRLFAAHGWRWKDEGLKIQQTEETFKVSHLGVEYEGQIDGILNMPDGRRGIIEYKTTSESILPDSPYWNKLGMDPQTGLYALASMIVPDFILYDVVRKPTINPKKISKADMKRLREELDENDQGEYFGEVFEAPEIENALYEGRETLAMYGARLTADIGNEPDKYFGRREVSRTQADYEMLMGSHHAQTQLIEYAIAEGLIFRNPDACSNFAGCKFLPLCQNNIRPRQGDDAPSGFHKRKHLHPELA